MAKADAKAPKGKDKKGADKKDKKGKKGKKGKGDGGPVLSVARHPKAGPQVRRAKGLGGLVGFLGAGLLAYQANLPAFDIGVRALAVGVVGYVVAWAAAVTVARVLLFAELRVLYEQLYPKPPAVPDAPPSPMHPGGPSAG